MVACSIPSYQKKANACRGIVAWEDEASFWMDGTLHQTWSRVGVQPRVNTFGLRKTAHVYGAIALHDASFTFQFAEVYNGRTFLGFLKRMVSRYSPQKIFLIIDNGPAHNLESAGKDWLRANRDKIELYRLPAYSPEFNPMEGVWKQTRKRSTHGCFYATPMDRDAGLRLAFRDFQRRPHLIAAQVQRYE